MAARSREQLLQNLQALHAEADRLIDKKKYALAKELALLALGALSVPSSDEANLWSGIQGELNDTLSESVTAFVKDIWESSLRLNLTYPEPHHLIQLFKAQTINATLCSHLGALYGQYTLDYTEIENMVHLHPHMRFGWKPAQFKELKEIMAFIEALKAGHQHAMRLDGIIRNYGDSAHHFNDINFQRGGSYARCPAVITDFARLQVMVSSLVKPDQCLCAFFGAGAIQQARGLSWLVD